MAEVQAAESEIVRAPPWPGDERFGRSRWESKEIDDAFIDTCLALWDEGKDTKEIATATRRHESVVARHVWAGRERRRSRDQ